MHIVVPKMKMHNQLLEARKTTIKKCVIVICSTI